MEKLINYFSRVLVALLLCTGVVATSCEGADPFGGENTEQGSGDNNGAGDNDDSGNNEGGGNGGDEGQPGEGDNGGKDETDDSAGTSGAMTWSLDKVTEVSATISGSLAVPASDLSFSQVTLYYSAAETFNVNDAKKVSTTTFDAEQNFTITVTGLTPGVKYNYCLIAEVKSEKTYGDVKDFTTALPEAPTLNAASEITEVSAIICGKVIPVQGVASDLQYGFQYCTLEDFSSEVTSKTVTDMDAEGNFSVRVSSLVPAQLYYVRSYVRMNGVKVYGEVLSFSAASLVAPTLNNASEIEMFSALISGKVTLPSETVYGLEYGFQYCTSADFASNVTTKKVTDLDSENKFSVQIASLVPTTYYYRSYIKMNGVYVYGEVKEFTTESPIFPSGYTNLAATTSANCYIVSQSGSYCFPVVRGNASSDWLYQTKASEVLWESFGTSNTPNVGDLIKFVSYKDGYIAFQTADTFKEGNAVIAAKDASGNILWSWHIWLTDQPQGQEYYNGAGTMMDRNLGATSATPGDVGALGLLYQWGRKDPFLGSSSISSSTTAKSTISWPSPVSSNSSRGTVSYVTANPTTFVYGTSSTDYDWHYSSRDNSLWTTSDKAKSIYDPCPAGWRVPDGGSSGVWSKALHRNLQQHQRRHELLQQVRQCFHHLVPCFGLSRQL